MAKIEEPLPVPFTSTREYQVLSERLAGLEAQAEDLGDDLAGPAPDLAEAARALADGRDVPHPKDNGQTLARLRAVNQAVELVRADLAAARRAHSQREAARLAPEMRKRVQAVCQALAELLRANGTVREILDSMDHTWNYPLFTPAGLPGEHNGDGNVFLREMVSAGWLSGTEKFLAGLPVLANRRKVS